MSLSFIMQSTIEGMNETLPISVYRWSRGTRLSTIFSSSNLYYNDSCNSNRPLRHPQNHYFYKNQQGNYSSRLHNLSKH